MSNPAASPEFRHGVGRLDWLEAMRPTGQMTLGDRGEQIQMVAPRWGRLSLAEVLIECTRAIIEELGHIQESTASGEGQSG